MGRRRQVRPEPVKWTRCGRSYSFPPVLSFNVVADTFSHGFLLKWSRDYADGYVSPVYGREKEKQSIKMIFIYKSRILSGNHSAERLVRLKGGKNAHQYDWCGDLLLTRQVGAKADNTLLTQTAKLRRQ